MKSNLAYTKSTSDEEEELLKERQVFQQILEAYLQEMICCLNLRILLDQNPSAWMEEPVFWVESIQLLDITYPVVPRKESLIKKIIKKLVAFQKRVHFW